MVVVMVKVVDMEDDDVWYQGIPRDKLRPNSFYLGSMYIGHAGLKTRRNGPIKFLNR